MARLSLLISVLLDPAPNDSVGYVTLLYHIYSVFTSIYTH